MALIGRAVGGAGVGIGRAPRVGLFRALLVAHAQMMVNRTKRGLGRRGLTGLALVAFILLVAALPLFATFGLLGYLFGRGIDLPAAAPLMGVILMGSTAGLGVVGGLVGGARQLTWEMYRSFPVTFRTLFFAETVASFGDLLMLAFFGVLVAMGGAFAWEAPGSTPLLLLLFAELALCVVFLEQLVGALAVSAVRSLRRALLVLVVAAWAGVSVVAGAARELKDDLQDARLERLETLWEHFRPFVNAFPTVLSARAIVAARDSRFALALRLELPLVATTALLGALSYAVLRRESRPLGTAGTRSNAASKADGRRFRGSPRVSPRWILARLHFHHVVGSLQGRFGLLVPLITLVLIKGPLASAGVSSQLTLPASVIYLGLASTQFHFNQFGLDGQGVKTLFLLPVATRDLLLGKACALLAYVTIQTVVLMALLGVMVRPTAADGVAALFLAASLAVAHVLQGHFISAISPRPLAMHRMNAIGLSGANLIPLGVGLVNAGLFGGVYVLATLQGPRVQVTALMSLLLVVIAVYRLVLPTAATFVEARREKLVETLG